MSDANSVMYKVRFLVKAASWDQVKTIFKENLGIEKDKKDDSVTTIRDHFVVEIELHESDLVDKLYENVQKCESLTILSDEFSYKNAQQVTYLIAPIELQLRELAVYAHDLVATYYGELKDVKSAEAKKLARSSKMLSEEVLDPLPSFLDLGELISFLGKTGNQVDESNLADDTARLIQQSATFDDFKKAFSERFKKQAIWDIIAEITLESPCEWWQIKLDLDALKEPRNAAAHFRTVKPSDLKSATAITDRLNRRLRRKKKPTVREINNLNLIFEKWNSALQFDAYQATLERIANINAVAFKKIIDQTSGLEALTRSLGQLRVPGLPIGLVGGLPGGQEAEAVDPDTHSVGPDEKDLGRSHT